jgi:general secretion pathway protein K
MALIVVLWLVVLLGVMAAGHARSARTETLLAARQTGYAQARARAEAGIHHVILEALTAAPADRRPADGTVFTVDVAGDIVTLAIRDASGLVDLNGAGAGLLDDLLGFCGVADEPRARLVDAILDWRDRDDFVHVHGVEDADYVAAGLPWSARDGAFRAVDELRYVMGMDPATFACLEPLVTIHSGGRALRLEYAPPALARALGGAPDGGRPAGAAVPGVRVGTYHIYATAMGQAGTVAAIEAVVRLTGSAREPFTLLEWREPPPAAPAPAGTGPT